MAGEILSEIILEADVISSKVVKKILNNLASDGGAILSMGGNISNPGSVFSVMICETNVDKMSRQIAKLFSEMLYEQTNGDVGGVGTDGNKQHIGVLLENLKKIHRLSIQIWKYIPEMLNSLIGLIDDELKAEDEKIRSLATETIGKMISCEGGGSVVNRTSFITSHKDIWFNWLKKTLDISPMVRCKWVEQVSRIIESSKSDDGGELVAELVKGLMKCLVDSDERVRFVACKTIDKIPYNKFIEKVCNEKILTTLFQLLREKNPEIRTQVMKLLGQLYNNGINGGTSAASDSSTSALINDIPNQILSLVYINDKQITSTVDISLFEQLLPLEANDVKRVDRLCHLYSNLDSKSKSSFLAINKRQQQVSGVLEKYIEISDSITKANKDDDDENKENITSLLEKLDKIITWLVASLPDGLNSQQCLERFYKLANFRFFYLLKISISVESEYATVKNSMKELLSKLNNPKNLKLDDDKTNISTTDMVSNMKLLMYRSNLIIFNKSNVTELISYSKKRDHQWNKVAKEILESISIVVPEVFKSQVKGLSEIVEAEAGGEQGEVLKTLYHFIKAFPDLFPPSPGFVESLKSFAINGTPSEAKYSVKIISFSKRKEIYCSSIFNAVYPLKIEDNEDKFATHLSSIAELFLCDPMSVEDKAGDITSFLIKEVLLKNRELPQETTSKWISNVEASPCLNEKLLSLRIFVNRLKVCLPDSITSVSQPVFKLLVSLIGNGGEIISDNTTPESFQCQLRLWAGYYILKLAKIPIFNELLTQSTINRLVFLLQDLEENVRKKFLEKLQKYLTFDSISEKFLPLIFFMGHEPNEELKLLAGTAIRAMYKRQPLGNGNVKFENSLLRLIHMVSHQQEFIKLNSKLDSDDRMKAYTYALEYIIFFLTNIAKAENVSLLYYLASRVKQYRDATIDDESLYDQTPLPQAVTNLYSIAELVQLIIKELCELRNWSMQTWPGKIKLSLDLFSPMKSTLEAQSIVTKVYIPDELILKLKALFKYKLNISKKKKSGPKIITAANTVSSASAASGLLAAKKAANKKRLHAGTMSSVKRIKSKSKSTKEVTGPLRKSSRSTNRVQYTEGDSDSSEDSASEGDEDTADDFGSEF